MMRKQLRSISTLFLLFSGAVVYGQYGLIVNEVSNGTSGAQEYIELLVVDEGAGGCTADIRGFIVDDNNGDFSCSPRSGAGIAQGHIRFSTTGPWANIPYGALIVLYNSADRNPAIPADDPFDANGDSVYVIGSSHADIEVSAGTGGCSGTDIPFGCGAACPGTGSSSYVPATYTFGGTWLGIGLRNSGGDASQVRLPGGTYFHGISYGSSNITGGPDSLNITTSSGSGGCYFFNSGDYRNVANFTVGSAPADQTPGTFNNAANRSFILAIRCTPLPVTYSAPLSGRQVDDRIQLAWATSHENGHDRFEVQRSPDPDGPFVTLGVLAAQQATSQGSEYQFYDNNPVKGPNYYRLFQVDGDGQSQTGSTISVNFDPGSQNLFSVLSGPGLETHQILNPGDSPLNIRVLDTRGTLLRILTLSPGESRELNAAQFPRGIYFLEAHSPKGKTIRKILL